MNRNTDFLPASLWNLLQNKNSNNNSSLFRLLLAKTNRVSFPFSFTFLANDFFILIHTTEGCGKVLIEKECYTLSANTLLLLNCKNHASNLKITTEPWNFRLFLISGGNFSAYFDFLPNQNGLLLPLPEYGQTALNIEQLFNSTSTSSSLYQLYQSNLINSILTDCILTKKLEEENTDTLPPYLIKTKQLFDEAFHIKYSLTELATELNINKYRLCREFNSAFGMSPIQYLNYHRIQIATQLLLTTDLKIHEVGSRVGIDNTNHFISLFRKIQGSTPLEYKQNMSNLKYNKGV